jgi:D-alanyl-D-alanine carboxypeptidase-like protein
MAKVTTLRRLWPYWRAMLAFLAAMLSGFADASTAEERTALDALVRAYPDFLAGYDATDLIWRDGTRMPLSERLPTAGFADMLRRGSILDQTRQAYPVGPLPAGMVPTGDPGRVRNRAFFDKMYGNCWRGEVRSRLVSLVWLPRSWGRAIEATSVNAVAQRLAAVSAEVDALPLAVKRYAYPPAGTYNCRTVADTGQPSMHAWGAAIDINTAYGDYWLGHRSGTGDTGHFNRIPIELVEIFERHGFIWGGKWSHYDTMHFEYRPELLSDRTAAGSQPAAVELSRIGSENDRRR